MKRKLIAVAVTAAMLLTLALSTGTINILTGDKITTATTATANELKTRNANIFDALEILKSLVGMDNKAAQLTGITDRELTIYDVLDILKGIVGMGEPVKMFIPAAVWEEVEIGEERLSSAFWPPFDLRRTITGQDSRIEDFYFNIYAFSGTVVGIKEFEVAWTDEDGKEWGPFSRSVIEVKVDKELYGTSPVVGNTIRLMHYMPLSWVFEWTVRIKEGGEYVFTNCQIFDENYKIYNEKYNRALTNTGIEQYADASIGSIRSDIFPIEDGKVIVPQGYFSHDENAMRRTLPADSVRTDKLVLREDAPALGGRIVMTMRDFEEEFLRLFENPERLPTVDYNPFRDSE